MTDGPIYRLPEAFEPDLEIEVTFLRPEEGGGAGPWRAFFHSEQEEGPGVWRHGFTPPFFYDGQLWIAFYLFAQDVIHPGAAGAEDLAGGLQRGAGE
jgi:hypothetical protein